MIGGTQLLTESPAYIQNKTKLRMRSKSSNISSSSITAKSSSSSSMNCNQEQSGLPQSPSSCEIPSSDSQEYESTTKGSRSSQKRLNLGKKIKKLIPGSGSLKPGKHLRLSFRNKDVTSPSHETTSSNQSSNCTGTDTLRNSSPNIPKTSSLNKSNANILQGNSNTIEIIINKSKTSQLYSKDNDRPNRNRKELCRNPNNQNNLKMNDRQKKSKTETQDDGFFCRASHYDGQTIYLDEVPTYEIGNYLGGGVAGVVYEGHCLNDRMENTARSSMKCDETIESNSEQKNNQGNRKVGQGVNNHPENMPVPPSTLKNTIDKEYESKGLCADYGCQTMLSEESMDDLKLDEEYFQDEPITEKQAREDISFEVHPPVGSSLKDVSVLVDQINPPSVDINFQGMHSKAVAIKILNPMGFKLLPLSATATAIIIKKGEVMDEDTKRGLKPMTKKHIWWLVHPKSRNIKILLERPENNLSIDVNNTRVMDITNDIQSSLSLNVVEKNSDDLDRGNPDMGLRLSLIASYIEPSSNSIKELPLNKCIEVWGNAPMGINEDEFEGLMDAIERVSTDNRQEVDKPCWIENEGKQMKEDIILEKLSSTEISALLSKNLNNILCREASSQRETVHCPILNAYISVPLVPPKYIRWLRQRRTVTKEIRNMLLVGNHKNVVRLYDVMEFIEETKSTMFLVLELVRGGELFDLISSTDSIPKLKSREYSKLSKEKEAEYIMLQFFRELASGIQYCHFNGIAHRDLKPENLLVHTALDGEYTLKIADFGLSSNFTLFGQSSSTNITPGKVSGRLAFIAEGKELSNDTLSAGTGGGLTPLLNRHLVSFQNFGVTALAFLTCGNINQVTEFGHKTETTVSSCSRSSCRPGLRRMTSIVGSPHYVAPEIISRSSKDTNKCNVDSVGYDGTKADVWSAGVILYAMLFRSLPFGEDLLQCRRYQSFCKWYEKSRKTKDACKPNGSSSFLSFEQYSDVPEVGPHWFFPNETSTESKDLIMLMLNPDPNERVSIKQVLKHPWMKMTF